MTDQNHQPWRLALLIAVAWPAASLVAATTAWPSVRTVESQPLLASIERLVEAMDYVGSPLPKSVKSDLKQLSADDDSTTVTRHVQELLDPLCLVGVSLQETGPPLVKPGQVKRELLEQGWRTFLVKVVNKPSKTRRLLIESPNAQPLPHSPADQVQSRWMQLSSFEGRPLLANLSGLELEYRLVQIYSRDPGPKKALLEFTVSNKAGDDGELIREWRFNKNADGWREMNQVNIAVKDGSLHITSSGNDPFMGADVDHRGGPMVLRFWAKSEVDGVGQLFLVGPRTFLNRPETDKRTFCSILAKNISMKFHFTQGVNLLACDWTHSSSPDKCELIGSISTRRNVPLTGQRFSSTSTADEQHR